MMGGDIIETFLNEARDLLEQLEAALLDLEKRPNDRELVNTTFRALHTLKGSGGMFGPPAMAAFAHELENAFEKVRQDHAPVTPALVSLLLQSADQIRKLLFEADGDEAAIRIALEEPLSAHLGKPVRVILRDAAALDAVLAANPFPDGAPNRTVVVFLDAGPAPDTMDRVTGRGEERIALGDREIWIDYGGAMRDSKLRVPGAEAGTARNLNTVAKLAAMARAPAP